MKDLFSTAKGSTKFIYVKHQVAVLTGQNRGGVRHMRWEGFQEYCGKITIATLSEQVSLGENRRQFNDSTRYIVGRGISTSLGQKPVQKSFPLNFLLTYQDAGK
jgi:hypothetical protein